MTYGAVNHDCLGRRILFPPMAAEAEQETMGVRIVRQMQVKNLNQSEVARILEVSRMTVNQWCNGTSEPRPENLLGLAELLFDGDVHYLVLGPSREPEGGFPTVPKSRDTGSTGSFASPFKRRRRRT